MNDNVLAKLERRLLGKRLNVKQLGLVLLLLVLMGWVASMMASRTLAYPFGFAAGVAFVFLLESRKKQ